jgi:hypothetical protein
MNTRLSTERWRAADGGHGQGTNGSAEVADHGRTVHGVVAAICRQDFQHHSFDCKELDMKGEVSNEQN